MSSPTFAELGVSDPVLAALARKGIAAPFAIQSLVISDALAGRDVLLKSPTGSGKTLAFGIPLVERTDPQGPRPAALVLAPTRELAGQIVAELAPLAHARSLRACAVYGGVGLPGQARQAARSQIIVATPGRLEDLLARGAFTLGAIRILVLDEADRMLDMGFRPAVERIIGACPERRQTLFCSATLAGETGRIAAAFTRSAVLAENGPRMRAAGTVEHRFVQVGDTQRLHALVRELSVKRDLALVFVRTKRGADRLVKHLDARGVRAVAMHGDKSQRQRERALASFQSGKIDTLVATDVAARGIDVEGISHVINFDAPGDRDSYVHRVGRTGRAGSQGVAITLVTADSHAELRRLAQELGIAHGLGQPAGGAQRVASATPRHAGRGRGRAQRRRQLSR
jgi:ATP-dependent RNA helicase RhlE